MLGGEWIFFEDLEQAGRTPIGESLEDDLRLSSTSADRGQLAAPGSAKLRIDGFRLTAFEPGSRPAALTGCENFVDKRVEVHREEGWGADDGDWATSVSGGPLQKVGEPLEGFKKISPRKIEKVLQGLGLCYRFDHSWEPTSQFEDARLDRELEGYHDRRCTAPCSGKVRELNFGPDHPSSEPGVTVTVTETRPHAWAEPPPDGTECPSQ